MMIFLTVSTLYLSLVTSNGERIYYDQEEPLDLSFKSVSSNQPTGAIFSGTQKVNPLKIQQNKAKDIVFRTIFNEKQQVSLQELVEHPVDSINLDPKAADIFKTIKMVILGRVNQDFSIPNPSNDQLATAGVSNDSRSNKIPDDVYKMAVKKALEEFFQLARFSFPYELYKETFDTFIKEVSTIFTPKNITDKNDMEFILRKVILFFMLGEIQKTEWRDKNIGRWSYNRVCLKTHLQNFSKKIEDFTKVAKEFLEQNINDEDTDMKKAREYIQMVIDSFNSLSTDNVTDYQTIITNLLTAVCALTNLTANTANLFNYPYDDIPLIYTFSRLPKKMKNNFMYKSRQKKKSSQKYETKVYLERFVKSLEILNKILGNPFKNFFNLVEEYKNTGVFDMNPTMLKTFNEETAALDKIKDKFSAPLQEALLDLLHVLTFEVKVFGRLNEKHCAFLQKHWDSKNISGLVFSDRFYSCLFTKTCLLSNGLRIRQTTSALKGIGKPTSCKDLKRSILERTSHMLFDFYEPLRESIDAIRNLEIIRVVDYKNNKEFFISLNQFLNKSCTAYTASLNFPTSEDLKNTNDGNNLPKNLYMVLALIPHYNFTLPLLELRELLKRLHSTNPHSWNKASDVPKLKAILNILYDRVYDFVQQPELNEHSENKAKFNPDTVEIILGVIFREFSSFNSVEITTITQLLKNVSSQKKVTKSFSSFVNNYIRELKSSREGQQQLGEPVPKKKKEMGLNSI
ncbi:hypothetical protein GINT2_000671 [Glugoides intestinalis]